MPRSKIVHVITGLKRGGAESVLLRLVAHLSGFEHLVISLGDEGDLAQDFRAAGIPVVSLRRRLHKLIYHLLHYKPDIVQTWMYHGDLFGGLAAKLLRYQTIIWNVRNSTLSTTEQYSQAKRTTQIIAKLCAYLSSSIPSKIVTCSYKAQKVHEALGYAANKFHLIPNGIDCQVFRPNKLWRQDMRASLGLPMDVPVVGMVARFDPQKDFPTFIKAAQIIRATHQQAHFLLIGPDNQALQHDIQQASLPIILMGQRQDIPQLLNALDLFMFSSAYGEAFPNAVAEAMACDIPCVATNVGDTEEIIGDTGVVVPPRNPAALAEAALQALSSPPSGQRQRVLDLFSLEIMLENYKQLYLEKTR